MHTNYIWISLPFNQQELESEMPANTLRRLRIGKMHICLARNIKGIFYAIQDDCPHRGAALHQGRINSQDEIICPLHAYRFDLRTGRRSAAYLCPDATVYPIRLNKEKVEIGIPKEIWEKLK